MRPTLGLLLFLAATLAAQTTPVRVEDSDQAVIKNGTWETVNDPAASGGTFIRTTNANAGASITLRFTGDSIRIFRQVLNTGGQARITIDDRAWGNVRFDFAETRMGAPIVIDGLGAGAHTLVMTVSADRPIFTQEGPVSVAFDAFEAPAAFTPSASQTAALARYNQIRALVGYPAARLSPPMSIAAQSHADYMTLNNETTSAENNGSPGFTGSFSSDRLRYVGYPGTANDSVASLGDPVAAVEFWMGNIEDRFAMLTPAPIEVGYGVSRRTGRLADTMLFSIRGTDTPAARLIVTYPADKQTGVPIGSNGNANFAPGALGYPISLHIQSVGRGSQRATTVGTLTGPNNLNIPVTLVMQGGRFAPIRDENTVFMVPNAPLTPGTTYTARITGADANNFPYDVTWSFTTASNAAIVDPRVIEVTPASVTIQWSTLGPVRTTSLQYGLTPTYGNAAPAPFKNDPANPNQWAVKITGLTSNTPYNYQISATDDASTQRTPNLVFATPPAAQPVLYNLVLTQGDLRWNQQGDGLALAPGNGTRFILTDLNGGELLDRDPVTLQVAGGRFVTVGAGDALQATGGAPGPNETFIVEFQTGTRLKAANGRYVSAQANGALEANAVQAGASETFTLGIAGNPVTIATSATFVKSDTASRGNWKGVYGADGYQVIGETPATPVYVAVTPAGHQTFPWTPSTDDPRAPLKPASALDRSASCWHAGTSFNVELNFNDAVPHQVAVYMLDWDRQGRAQRVEVLDAGGAVLDTRNVTGFENGQYLVWNLAGRVTLRFTNSSNAPNAVLSGLFFGPGGLATYSGRDGTTSGNWKGVYGGDGFELLGESARIPAYATVAATGAQTQTWNDDTDERYPQRAFVVAGDRTVAAWASATNFSVDVTLNDGKPHRLSLYMVDVDLKNRRQKVELLDANGLVIDSRDVAGFDTGAYLSWMVAGRVIVRVTNNNPATNAVVQALFFGPASPAAGPAPLPAPAGNWQLIDGILDQVAAASDGTFFGANAARQLYQRSVAGWVQLPGLASLVAASSANRLYGSNGSDLYIFDGTGWTQVGVPDGVVFTWLSASADGTLMAVDNQRRIHRRDPVTGTWSIAGTNASRVAVRNFGEFYFVDPEGAIQRNWGGKLTRIAGTLADITVAASGELWGLSPAGAVLQFNGAGFTPLPGRLTQLVVGNPSTIYGIVQDLRQIYRFQ